MNNLQFFASKVRQVQNIPRYMRELPSYMRGVGRGTTVWGDQMLVPFPEFRSICEKGYIEGGEEAVFEYFNQHITASDTFFDIGANAGFYALLANSKGAQVHAFEPFPSTFALLAQNAHEPVHIYPYAISDSSGTVHMLKGERSGLNSVSDDGDLPVQAISLDEFNVIPTIMKVDVEGNEMKVFKGAEKMLRAHMPTIVVEGSPEVTVYLESLGYTSQLLGNAHSGNYLFIKK